MDPDTEGGTGEAGGRLRRRPRAVAAAGCAGVVVLVAAATGVVVSRHHDAAGAAPLVLRPAGAAPAAAFPLEGARASGGAAIAPDTSVYHFRLATTAPDLGSRAAVGRLVAPPLGADRIFAMGKALGMANAHLETLADGTWLLTGDGRTRLELTPTTDGWSVAYSQASNGTPTSSSGGSSGSAPGGAPVPTTNPNPGSAGGSTGASTGAGSDAGSAGASSTGTPGTGSGATAGTGNGSTLASPPPPTAVPPITVAPAVPVSPPPTAAGLPDAQQAERVARALLVRMGVSGDWAVSTTPTAVGDTVSCGPAPCATPDYLVVVARTVVFRPRFAGVAIDRLGWQIGIGERGRVTGVAGTWSDLRTVGRNPLRSVTSVFADLAAGRGIDPNPVPMAVSAPGAAVSAGRRTPIDVAIDHIALGEAVFASDDGGHAVTDIVPTYVFTGHTANGETITRSLVAVAATLTTTVPAPTPSPAPTNIVPPSAVPLPEPAVQPTMAGTPPR